ncbi:MAG TPA: C40 family peptidase [Bacteroidales bacterium]|nr:C40 family peptidase [Bacteroidales bacterium]
MPDSKNNEGLISFGFCQHSAIPVRTEPSHRAEMCTQLLFGDLYVILESFEDWRHVRSVYDNYEGWVNKSSIMKISEEEFRRLESLPCRVTTEIVQLIENRSRQYYFPILIGSSLHGLEDNTFSAGQDEYVFEGETDSIPQDGSRAKVIEMAIMYLQSPYMWGGRSPFGIDCSGFTQMTYKIAGIQLLRDASQQATQGETISFISDARPGDLLFFDDEEGMITHTGILMPEGRVIHASGKVRIDQVDHQGIFNVESGQYSHQLRLIKKIL